MLLEWIFSILEHQVIFLSKEERNSGLIESQLICATLLPTQTQPISKGENAYFMYFRINCDPSPMQAHAVCLSQNCFLEPSGLHYHLVSPGRFGASLDILTPTSTVCASPPFVLVHSQGSLTQTQVETEECTCTRREWDG